MSVEREHETTVTMAGLTIPVTVVFRVITFGSSPTGYGFDGSYDPGESDEIEIISVLTEFGRDIIATLAELRRFPTVQAVAVWRDASCDPILEILAPYSTELMIDGNSELDRIEGEILDDASLMAPPDDGDDCQGW